MLNKQIAQKIVDKISTVLPYNINIMDKEGIIIGSSNKNRIGTIHYGAAEALTEKKEVEIYNEDEFVKPGLNIPIFFKDEIEGVIGITGNPEDISAFGNRIELISDNMGKYSVKIAVSSSNENLNKSFIEAMDTLNIISAVYKSKKILFFDSIRLINNSIMNLNYSEIEKMKNKLYEQNGGKELLETLLKFIEFNGEKNKVSEILHIHRNTLNYRLNNIEEITGLKLNDYMDLYQLILFFLCIRMKDV
ncbi:hypothetical protein EHW71_06730 [Clostridium butyricum]|uniref:CdaR family transcriptional regulator n=1 Tax=Clostridium butyricum TaxID=1492 RepID=UPI000F53B1FF|nr:sugar diacid recognition domain-containing protein [Clostridium butyricum]RQN11272.1 hypothetical protein EHW71_06730 [Clostridium butyricum]